MRNEVTNEELAQWAANRDDDAGHLARELIQYRIWRPMSEAPKDKTWILIRGRNSVGQPMIPVVGAWMPDGAAHQGWVDSGSFKPLDALVADADWQPLSPQQKD